MKKSSINNNFTLMVVGQSGVGKSTLIQSMVFPDAFNIAHPVTVQTLRTSNTSIEKTKAILSEDGANLSLTVLEIPGFRDGGSNNPWALAVECVERKYRNSLNTRSKKQTTSDQLVHCCLYLIEPSEDGLERLDIECMKRLCDKVNIIPVIAKADTRTDLECGLFKTKVVKDFTRNNIRLYEGFEENKLNRSLKALMPLGIVSPNSTIEGNRMKSYPWEVDIANLMYNFSTLRNTVLFTHMQHLKNITNFVHCEMYKSDFVRRKTVLGKLKICQRCESEHGHKRRCG